MIAILTSVIVGAIFVLWYIDKQMKQDIKEMEETNKFGDYGE